MASGQLERGTQRHIVMSSSGDVLVGDLDGHADADVLDRGAYQVAQDQARARLLGQLAEGDHVGDVGVEGAGAAVADRVGVDRLAWPETSVQVTEFSDRQLRQAGSQSTQL